jgi:hypothetical protein
MLETRISSFWTVMGVPAASSYFLSGAMYKTISAGHPNLLSRRNHAFSAGRSILELAKSATTWGRKVVALKFRVSMSIT